MLEDNFVVSLLVLWQFLLQCSTQTHQLRSISIPYDGFTWLQQLIIELLPPNSENNLSTMSIRSGLECGGISGNSLRFSALMIIVVDLFFVIGHNAMWKPLPIPSLMQTFTSKETPFNISRLQLVRNPISNLLNHFHGFEAFWNGLLSDPQWLCQFFLCLALVFSK